MGKLELDTPKITPTLYISMKRNICKSGVRRGGGDKGTRGEEQLRSTWSTWSWGRNSIPLSKIQNPRIPPLPPLSLDGTPFIPYSPLPTPHSLLCGLLTMTCWMGMAAVTLAIPQTKDTELKIGVVQRFGDELTDELTLQATPGDRLQLKFTTSTQAQTKSDRQEEMQLSASNVKLAVQMQTLVTPVLQERVVLSTHRSFETAEDAAKQWRALGIAVEIAQPEQWQVWAKRQVYNTPFLRRMLLSSVQIQGKKTAYLDSQILQQVPIVSWEVNGNRYSSDRLEVSANKDLIQVRQGKADRYGIPFSGKLRLQPNAYGTYTLVNNVPLETYLRGVVPHEIGRNVPYAAVEAQTIIARTYALRNLRRFAIDGYELCADTQCQVYVGLKDTDPKADRAILATKGKVLTYNNQLVDALYSSTTGGVTAAFSDVWNGSDKPYLRYLVDSAYSIWNLSRQSLADENNFQQFINMQRGFNEAGTRLFRWRKESPIEQLTQDLQKFLGKNRSPLANFTSIQQMQVMQRSPGGRILKLAVQTDRGNIMLEKDEIRSAFSVPRSTLFYLEPLYNQTKGENPLRGYVFVGGGMGHGVGLSQTGASGLAKLGWTSDRILNFYYPGTQVREWRIE